MKLHRRRQKARIAKLQRKKTGRSTGKGRAWNKKNKNKKKNLKGKEKQIENKQKHKK